MVIRDRGLLNMVFWSGVMRIVSASGFSLVAGYITVASFPLGANDIGFGIAIKLGLIALVTFIVHVLVSGLFGLDEARPIFTWIRRRIILRPNRQGPFNLQ